MAEPPSASNIGSGFTNRPDRQARDPSEILTDAAGLFDAVLDPGHGDAAENHSAIDGQIEQVDVDTGLGDLAEHGRGTARAVLGRGDHDLTLVLDLEAGVDEGPSSLLAILDEDVVNALAVADEAAGAFDVDPRSPERITGLGKRPGSITQSHGQIG